MDWKERKKVLLFADAITAKVENRTKLTSRLWELINEFRKLLDAGQNTKLNYHFYISSKTLKYVFLNAI